MLIKKEYPPNFEAIKSRFPLVLDKKGILYCYGDVIFNPDGFEISDQLWAHEAVHSSRQTNPADWWDKYLIDTDFRFSEELLAHQWEYKSTAGWDRNARIRYLHIISQRLAGPLYETGLTPLQVFKRIQNG